MIQVVGGIAVGAAAMMMAPSIVPIIAGAFKPVAKTLIKGGLLAYESGMQAVQQTSAALTSTVASTIETIEDLSAEAKAEILESQKAEISESQPAAVKKAKKKAA
jgi:hypothetical protein